MKLFLQILLIAFVIGITYPTHAQEVPPIYSPDDVIITYYERNIPYALNDTLIYHNVCLETFLRLNPQIDITNVPYGTQIRLPKDEKCYQYLDDDGRRNVLNDFGLGIKGNPLRLKFYEAGQWLDEPYYSDAVVYIHREPRFPSYPAFPTAQEIADIYGVCLEALLDENYLLHEYAIYKDFRANSIDVFIPSDLPECPPTPKAPTEDDIIAPSDLSIYIAEPHQNLFQIADELNVCVLDLIRANPFADFSIPYVMELAIPSALPCPEQFPVLDHHRINVKFLAVNTLYPTDVYMCEETISDPTHMADEEAVIDDFCYLLYTIPKDSSIYDIERTMNVCFEEFREITTHFRRELKDVTAIYVPQDALPCYNEQGQRLRYPEAVYWNSLEIYKRISPSYSDMQVYHSQQEDTLYDISKMYNVCVRDLLLVNPLLRHRLPQGHPVFIPDVRPCYDETTGKQWIYDDNYGNLLPEPVLSDYLLHYGEPIVFNLEYYYNVCLNRILDATENADTDRLNHYAGYIIPTDRPPCYNDNWQKVAYVCYDQSIGHTTNYQPNTTMTFNVDGTHCYDLKDPDTIIWHDNTPYRLFYLVDRSLRSINSGIVAWCFGLTVDEIASTMGKREFAPIRPHNYYIWTIPLPKRDCYLTNPDILVGKTIHTVQEGETLNRIRLC